jgi:transposase
LQSVPGLKQVLAPQLAAGLPELGTLDRKAIASLAGVAPHPRQSGRKAKPQPVRGGRSAMRRVLYLMALTASRQDPVIKAHYQQLLARGKPKKVALLACARRMLGIINAMVRDGLTWQQTKVGQGHFLPAPP